MEATKEWDIDKILPPALEEAGLEDCALPPESIHEAFRKAADAVTSRAALFSECNEEGSCVADPCPAAKGLVTDGGENQEAAGLCVAGMGIGEMSEEEKGGNVLVVVGGGGRGGGGRCCGDSMKDPGAGGIVNRVKKDQNQDEEDEEKPILVEAFV